VSAPAQEDFLTLYCDPGEDFGWCVGRTLDLLAAGTEKMWPFADAIWDKIRNPLGAILKDPVYVDTNPLSSDTHTRDGVDVETMRLPIGRIVCEDFRIYPPGVGSGPPLHENRHQNDAIQHFVFFTNTELLQLPLPVPDSVREEDHT
jgi:hypothetical protein